MASQHRVDVQHQWQFSSKRQRHRGCGAGADQQSAVAEGCSAAVSSSDDSGWGDDDDDNSKRQQYKWYDFDQDSNARLIHHFGSAKSTPPCCTLCIGKHEYSVTPTHQTNVKTGAIRHVRCCTINETHTSSVAAAAKTTVPTAPPPSYDDATVKCL